MTRFGRLSEIPIVRLQMLGRTPMQASSEASILAPSRACAQMLSRPLASQYASAESHRVSVRTFRELSGGRSQDCLYENGSRVGSTSPVQTLLERPNSLEHLCTSAREISFPAYSAWSCKSLVDQLENVYSSCSFAFEQARSPVA